MAGKNALHSRGLPQAPSSACSSAAMCSPPCTFAPAAACRDHEREQTRSKRQLQVIAILERIVHGNISFERPKMLSGLTCDTRQVLEQVAEGVVDTA